MLELQSEADGQALVQGMAASSTGIPHLSPATKEAAVLFPFFVAHLNVSCIPPSSMDFWSLIRRRGYLWSGFTLVATTAMRRLSEGEE